MMGPVLHRHRFSLPIAASALLGTWALAEGSPLSIPLGVAFLVAIFAWSLSRRDSAPRPSASGDLVCAGCVSGCVGCRERIDAPA